jgi:hypothetical protein
MKRTHILVEEAFKEWRQEPAYVAAYDALSAFAATMLVSARPH